MTAALYSTRSPRLCLLSLRHSRVRSPARCLPRYRATLPSHCVSCGLSQRGVLLPGDPPCCVRLRYDEERPLDRDRGVACGVVLHGLVGGLGGGLREPERPDLGSRVFRAYLMPL